MAAEFEEVVAHTGLRQLEHLGEQVAEQLLVRCARCPAGHRLAPRGDRCAQPERIRSSS
jgi:hypothetical protein